MQQNIFDMLTQSAGGDLVGGLANQFGLDRGQAEQAVRQLAPAVGAGINRNTQDQKGLADLLEALQRGNHGQYLENPDRLQQQQAVDEGNGILGHIFGSKEVSRQIAGQAAQRAGIGEGIMKKMLPVIAAAVMGGLAKKMTGAGSREIADSVMNRTAKRSGSMIGRSLGKSVGNMGKGLIGAMVAKYAMKAIFGGGQRNKQSIFGSLLDRDGDGSYADDILNMAVKGLLK